MSCIIERDFPDALGGGAAAAAVEEALALLDDEEKNEEFVDDCDVLSNKSVVSHIPVVKGKGSLHPPWTWRYSQRRVREWRELLQNEQVDEKQVWRDLGQAEQDQICRMIRIRHQTRSLRLSARDKSVTYSASKRLTAARSDFDSACERKRSAEREIEEAKKNLDRAQQRLKNAILANSNLDGSIENAKDSLDRAELSEPTDWTDMYNRLKEYRDREGDCNVPISKSNPPELKRLATWMVRQRACYRNYRDPPENPDGTLQQVSIGSLNAQKIDALENLGFIWDTKDHQWRKMFQELVAYKKEHGNLRINFNTHRPLYRWADRQKLQYVILKKGEPSLLTSERVRLLQSVDFPWWKENENAAPTFDRSDEWWSRQYEELRLFHSKYGHVRISRNQGAQVKDEKVSFRLVEFGTWNRKQYKIWKSGDRERSRLNDDRIHLLRDLGFEFDPHARVRDSISGGLSTSGGDSIAENSTEVDDYSNPAVKTEFEEEGIRVEEAPGGIVESDAKEMIAAAAAAAVAASGGVGAVNSTLKEDHSTVSTQGDQGVEIQVAQGIAIQVAQEVETQVVQGVEGHELQNINIQGKQEFVVQNGVINTVNEPVGTEDMVAESTEEAPNGVAGGAAILFETPAGSQDTIMRNETGALPSNNVAIGEVAVSKEEEKVDLVHFVGVDV